MILLRTTCVPFHFYYSFIFQFLLVFILFYLFFLIVHLSYFTHQILTKISDYYERENLRITNQYMKFLVFYSFSSFGRINTLKFVIIVNCCLLPSNDLSKIYCVFSLAFYGFSFSHFLGRFRPLVTKYQDRYAWCFAPSSLFVFLLNSNFLI